MARRLVLLGISILVTLTLAAQNRESLTVILPEQQHRESLTVEIVDVPVYVTRGFEPVDGLTRDDFELYVNGERQPIEYFDILGATAEAGTLRDRRLFLLLFDVAFTHPHSVPRAQAAASKLIANAEPGDYFAVATYSTRRGVWFAVPFTRDREALGRAIANLNAPRSGDPLAIVMTASERASFDNWEMDTHSSGDPSNAASRIAGDTMRDLAFARTLRAAEDQAEDLEALSVRMAALEGEKHVVVMSEGYDGQSPNRSDARSAGSIRRWNDSDLPGLRSIYSARVIDHTLAASILTMHRAFQRSNVVLHALDLQGVSNSLVSNDSLAFLASGTGGQFLHSTNDFGGALTRLASKLSRGYRLGFHPGKSVRRGYNSLEVKVRKAGRGVRVNHREGFDARPERANTEDGVYLADVVLNDVPQSGTSAKLALRGDKLFATIPMGEVAAQLPDGGGAELLVYGFAANGQALVYHRATIAVSAGATGEKTLEIAMPEGTQVAKALLRIDGGLGFSKVVK